MEEAVAPGRLAKPYFFLCALVAALTATLIVYSQTYAFAWDEGFHLLTAQLIMRGKTPYLDLCFPQTLLNAYWNALWMRVFGDTWRTAHAVAALMSAGAVMLTVDYLYVRFPVKNWRLAAASRRVSGRLEYPGGGLRHHRTGLRLLPVHDRGGVPADGCRRPRETASGWSRSPDSSPAPDLPHRY